MGLGAADSINSPAPAVIGVDIGSTFSKAVVYAEGAIVSWAIIPSGGDYRATADNVVQSVLDSAGLAVKDIGPVVATGYGAASVSLAAETASDVSCHSRGVHYFFDSVRTAVDIGGQFTRVFRVDAGGRAVNFVFSEKCAAGSGRLLQIIARVLQVEFSELGDLSLRSQKKVDFTTGCAVFSESEAVSRIAEGEAKEDIAAGIHRVLAAKVQTLVERVGFAPDCALIGGGAKDIGLVKKIEEGLEAEVLIPEEPQITAALGAALIAAERRAAAEPAAN